MKMQLLQNRAKLAAWLPKVALLCSDPTGAEFCSSYEGLDKFTMDSFASSCETHSLGATLTFLNIDKLFLSISCCGGQMTEKA